MKLPLYTISIFLLITLVGFVSYYFFYPEKNIGSEICFNDQCYSLEIAETALQKQRGLMDREYLAPNTGMYFPYQEDRSLMFWMKNTLIPLDIIWFDENLEVVYLSAHTPPCVEDPCPVYGPNFGTRSVLEINAGEIERIGINVGSFGELR